MRGFLTVTVLLTLSFSGYASAADCELGDRYLVLAQERVKNYATDEAEAFLQKAVESCPSYAAYEQLGELAAQSSDFEHRARAAEAFVNAHELATTDAARARTLYQYASLLDASGDPQNAYPMIKAAKTLDGGNASILALEKRLDEQIGKPTTEQLRAGLKGSLYRPLRLASTNAALGATRVAALAMPAPAAGTLRGSNNVPIHFVTGATTVDDATRPNIRVLASALAAPEFANSGFVLVGHADERGDDGENMALSWRRATAVRGMLESLQPSLKGRLDISGRGETEPLDAGHDEQAYRANRRIQVLPK